MEMLKMATASFLSLLVDKLQCSSKYVKNEHVSELTQSAITCSLFIPFSRSRTIETGEN
jgi:hypothetical protein